MPGKAVFSLPCLAVYHSKHPNPVLYSGAGGQLGDWKVRTGVTGETSEHKGFSLSLMVFLVGVTVGRLSVLVPHCKTGLCETVAVTLQMFLKKILSWRCWEMPGDHKQWWKQNQGLGTHDVKLDFSCAVDHSLLHLCQDQCCEHAEVPWLWFGIFL